MKDFDAGLKLKTALLKLGIARPHGFNARQLSEIAAVGYETARDFLKPSTGSGYTRVVEKPNDEPATSGRPPVYHRLTSEGRLRLMNEVLTLRRQLESAERTRESSFRLIERLRETVSDLAKASAEEVQDLLDAADLELQSCLVELEFLNRSGSPFRGDFSRSLDDIVKTLTLVRQSEGLPIDQRGLSNFDTLAEQNHVTVDQAGKAISPLLANLGSRTARRITEVLQRWAMTAAKSGEKLEQWIRLLDDYGSIAKGVDPLDADLLQAVAQSIGRRIDLFEPSGSEALSSEDMEKPERTKNKPKRTIRRPQRVAKAAENNRDEGQVVKKKRAFRQRADASLHLTFGSNRKDHNSHRVLMRKRLGSKDKHRVVHAVAVRKSQRRSLREMHE